MRSTCRRARHWRSHACLAAAATCAFAGAAAGQIAVSYTGAPGGDWLAATNWSPNLVPNNNPGLNLYYNAINTSTVVRPPGIQIFIQQLTNTGSVTLLGDLGFDGPGAGGAATISNTGTIAIQPAVSTSVIVGTQDHLTVSGGGTITMLGAGNHRFFGGGTLTNGDNLIVGRGSLGEGVMRIHNNGTISSGGGTLTVSFKDDMTNGGTIVAPADSTLNLVGHFGSTLFNTGRITADGGTVRLAGVRIEDGILSTANSGTIIADAGNVTLDGVTHEGRMTVAGIVNLESFFASSGSVTVLTGIRTAGTVALSGGGTIILSGGTLGGTASNPGVLVNTSNTIRGRGQLDSNFLTVVNQADGQIVAEGGTLTIGVGSGGFVNGGVVRVAAGATLNLNGGAAPFENAGGAISVGTNAIVRLNNGIEISGGTFEAVADAGLFEVPTFNLATLRNVYMDAPLNVVGQAIMQNDIDGEGQINLRQNAVLSIRDSATLKGSRAVIMETQSTIRAETVAPLGPDGLGPQVTNVGTLVGAGLLGNNTLRIINDGTIIGNASTSGQPLNLTIDPSPEGLLNAGVIESADLGRVILTGSGSGAFAQTGGGIMRAQDSSSLELRQNALVSGGQFGAGAGTINIVGPITIESLTSDARIVQSSSSTLLINQNVVNTGTITTAGGSTLSVAGASTLNSGSGYHVNNGTVLINSGGFADFDYLEATAAGSGRLLLNAGAQARAYTLSQATLSVANDSFLTLKSSFAPGVDGSLVNNLSIGSIGAAIDITNRGMVVNYFGATVLPAIAAQVAGGHAGGAWNGPGIRSSSAAANAGFGVGYAEAAAVGSPATFLGRPIDASTVLLRYTRLGDADLDGTVNIADFARLAANFNMPGPWSSGNFDYDATVGIADFALLAANFNLSVPADAPRGAATPEPAAAAAVLLAAAASWARRPGRCRRR